MSRTTSHHIESMSVDLIKTTINKFNSGNLLFRDISGRDYGIDGMVEIFEDGIPTGKIALIQMKGTENKFELLKKTSEVSCNVSISNLYYTVQKNIPVILIYASLEEQIFLYRVMNCIFNEKQIDTFRVNGNKTKAIRIPVSNNSSRLDGFIKQISEFY